MKFYTQQMRKMLCTVKDEKADSLPLKQENGNEGDAARKETNQTNRIKHKTRRASNLKSSLSTHTHGRVMRDKEGRMKGRVRTKGNK